MGRATRQAKASAEHDGYTPFAQRAGNGLEKMVAKKMKRERLYINSSAFNFPPL